jgi:hypothetical protein
MKVKNKIYGLSANNALRPIWLMSGQKEAKTMGVNNGPPGLSAPAETLHAARVEQAAPETRRGSRIQQRKTSRPSVLFFLDVES